MKISDLDARLAREGVRPDAVSVHGAPASEAYAIQARGGAWVTFYAERGLETGLRTFATEAAACEHLLHQVLDDPTTRRR